MSLSASQQTAFSAASGVSISGLNFDVKLLVGGVAILCSLLVLIGLMRLLDTNAPYDKVVFLMSISGLSFVLMLIFIYLA